RPEDALADGIIFDEADGPGHRGRRAPQLLVDEVGKPPEEQAKRHAAGHIIVDAKPAQLLLMREIKDSERCADDAPVERHAAVPQLQYLDRVPDIFAEIVEQHIAEPPTEK